MAKITSIIDIGSNSIRMVIFEKSSRFGFFLINETKYKIQIGKGGYKKDGKLQKEPMEKAYEAIKSFKQISNNLKSKKILLVATSALRDAPNKNEFINKIKKKLNLNIRVIDGQKEAYYGQVAVSNLLHTKDFFTIDIGGGSTEIAFVKDGKNIENFSFDIGTVRLKELYFDKQNVAEAKNHIFEELKKVIIPDISLFLRKAVVLGGSARAISTAIIKQSNYPLDIVHGFSYKVAKQKYIFENILNAKNNSDLNKMGIKEDRYDTIKAGCFILKTILEYFKVKQVITSQVGVREGVYLCDILRTQNHKFPANFNISQRSLMDRFGNKNNNTRYTAKLSNDIFDELASYLKLKAKYKDILKTASTLHKIGQMLNFHNNQKLSSDFILYGLDYGFCHKNRILIATIIKLTTKKRVKKRHILKYKKLLPKLKTIIKLVFILKLAIVLSQRLNKQKHKFKFNKTKGLLNIQTDNYSSTTKDEIQKIDKDIKIVYEAFDG